MMSLVRTITRNVGVPTPIQLDIGLSEFPGLKLVDSARETLAQMMKSSPSSIKMAAQDVALFMSHFHDGLLTTDVVTRAASFNEALFFAEVAKIDIETKLFDGRFPRSVVTLVRHGELCRESVELFQDIFKDALVAARAALRENATRALEAYNACLQNIVHAGVHEARWRLTKSGESATNQ